jgi:signal transduction histidine kinase
MEMEGERPDIEEVEPEGLAATWTSEELAAIDQVASAVSTQLDLQTILEGGLDSSLQALKLEMGWIRLFEGGELRVRVVRGLGAEQAESLMLLETTEGACAAAMDKGRPVVIHGAPGDPAGVYPVLRRHGLHSYLAMPLSLHGAALGILVAISATPFRFTPHQVQLIRVIAGQISIAVEHAFLHDAMDRERQRQLGELERLGRLKDDFLSMASHELKTPITSIKVFSELAARREHRPEVLATLGRQADRLVAMINNLLDISRLQLGQMPMEMGRVDLAALAAEFCNSFSLLFKERTVSFESAPELGKVLVEGDPVRLEQVLSNLLDNALKCSSKGSRIWVRVGRKDDKALMEVQDEGTGIPAEELARIFERYYRIESQGAPSGLGLGLHIAKEIVERHGGRIWAESEVGKGSTFYVELPLAQQA